MMKSALARVRRLFADDSGANTVEWVLLFVVALVVLISVYLFAQHALDRF